MDPFKKTDDVLIAGIGGAGVKVIERFSVLRPLQNGIIAIDTNDSSLSASISPKKLLIGRRTLSGAGTGGSAEKGRLAASESLEQIRDLVSGKRYVICVAGIGGGTGTGAIPVFLKVAKEAGAVTVGVVTTPFSFEGRAKNKSAVYIIEDLKQIVDALIVANCDNLVESAGGRTAVESFELAEKALVRIVDAVSSIISGRTLVGIDLLKAQQMFKKSGEFLSAGVGLADGEDRAVLAAKRAVNDPMLERGSLLKNAPSALVYISAGDDVLFSEAEKIMRIVTESCNDNAEIYMGLNVDSSLEGISVIIFTVKTDSALTADEAVEKPQQKTQAPTQKSQEKTKFPKADKSRKTALSFSNAAGNRFEGIGPTIVDGEDLDQPTFIRRNIRIER